MYQEVPRNTKKYPEVPRSIQKYEEISRSTKKELESPKENCDIVNILCEERARELKRSKRSKEIRLRIDGKPTSTGTASRGGEVGGEECVLNLS